MTTPTQSMPPASFHILLALAGRPQHGLGIAHEIESRTEGRVVMGPGTLYGTIRKLVDADWIAETTERPHPRDDDPRRRYYCLTSAGDAALRQEIASLSRVLDTAKAKSLMSELS